jgi:hypothetical protein
MKKLFLIIILQLFIVQAFAQDIKLVPQKHSVQVGLGIGDIFSTFFERRITERDIDYYKRQVKSSKIFFTSYSYRAKKWLALETRLSYKFSRTDYNNIYTLDPYSHNNEHQLYLGVIGKFKWLNTKIVSLYSSVGLCYLYKIDKDFSNGATEVAKTIEVLPHITYIGISVGRRVYGFSEFGIQPSGILSFGIGYRF